MESILLGKELSLRRRDHGKNIDFLILKYFNRKGLSELFAGAQRADCHDEHHLQPQCGRQVLHRGLHKG